MMLKLLLLAAALSILIASIVVSRAENRVGW